MKNQRMGSILAVDDDLGILKFLKITLSSEGFAVDTSSSGADALRKFQEGNYDLILTDICMPGLNGNYVAQKVRTLNKDIPVVGMPAAPWLEEGCFDQVIEKPFSLKSLVDLLDRLIPQRRTVQLA